MTKAAENPIIKAAGLRFGDRVLEIGFRQIKAMQLFAELVGDQGSVTGLDINSEHVAQAQEALRESSNRNIHAVEGSILDLPFPDEAFDIVFCLGVLHEIRDVNCAFREMARVLRPNGRTAIADFQRFSRLKFAIYRMKVRFRGEVCMDVHPGFTHQQLAAQLQVSGLYERSYKSAGEWRMGFIRCTGFRLVASKGLP